MQLAAKLLLSRQVTPDWVLNRTNNATGSDIGQGQSAVYWLTALLPPLSQANYKVRPSVSL